MSELVSRTSWGFRSCHNKLSTSVNMATSASWLSHTRPVSPRNRVLSTLTSETEYPEVRRTRHLPAYTQFPKRDQPSFVRGRFVFDEKPLCLHLEDGEFCPKCSSGWVLLKHQEPGPTADSSKKALLKNPSLFPPHRPPFPFSMTPKKPHPSTHPVQNNNRNLPP